MTTCTCDGTLRLVSLFDGIAGFPLAFERAGVPTVATVEIDKAAAGVAAAHFPDAHHFADVTEVTADELVRLGLCPVHTVVSAGWPCTDLSLAGLRLGLGGARSGLVGEVFRLLLGLRPGWFVLENVPGLLSSVCPCPGGGVCDDARCLRGAHPVRGGACGRRRDGARRLNGAGRCMALHGGGMGTVLRRLVECGYGLSYRVLDAQHFGVPQRRRRVVIVGHLGDAAGPVEVLLEPEGGGGHPAAGRAAGAGAARGAGIGPAVAGREADVAPTLAGGGRRGYRVDAETAAGGGLITTALTRNSITGTDDNTARGGQLVAVEPEVWQQQGSKLQPMGTMRRGNGNVTGGVPFLATTITAREAKGPDPDATSGNLVTHALTAEGHDASEDGTGRGTPLVPVTVPTLTASMGSNNAAPGNGGKDEMVVPVAYAPRADPGGVGQEHNTNYVPVDLAQVTSGENRSNPQPGDPAATLAATSRPAVAFGHTNGIDVRPSETVAPTMRAGHGVGGGGDATAAAVRRLTPVECERLQGYPDGWTEKAVRLERDGNRWLPAGETVQADSPRYRELGNSIAVPVFVWVAERIVRADRGERP